MGCRYCNFDGICEYFVNEDDDDIQLDEIARNCDELTEIIDKERNCFAEMKIREFFIELAFILKYGKVLYFIHDCKLIPYLNRKYGLGKLEG